jgi:anti-sigma B factor antagonist
MPLNVRNRQVKDVAILDLSGKITLGDGTGVLRDEIASLLAQGEKKILVNMGGITYVDSAGLGELVRAYTTAASHGASLKLLHLQGKMRDLLQITKLHTIFQTFNDEATALASY